MTLWPRRFVSIASPKLQANWASSTATKMTEAVTIAPPVSPWQGVVDYVLGKQGARELKRSFDHEERHGPENEGAIRPYILKQPPHETRIIWSRQRIFVVNGCGARHRAVC